MKLSLLGWLIAFQVISPGEKRMSTLSNKRWLRTIFSAFKR
jgi:hypothetical protein